MLVMMAMDDDGNGRGQLGRLAARREFGSPHQGGYSEGEEPLAGTGRGGESLPTYYTSVAVESAGKPLDALEETPEKSTRLPAVGCNPSAQARGTSPSPSSGAQSVR